MFNSLNCANRVFKLPHMEQKEDMEANESDNENFTNFSISEILKPDFGRKHLTTGVLNLSRESTNTCEPREQTDKYTFSWSTHPFHQFGLKFGVFSSPTCASTKLSDIPLSSHTVSHQSKTYGLNLDVGNITDKQNEKTDTKTDRRRNSCSGSDGESTKSSPATSPAGSPGSSPESSNNSKAGAEKLWPAWVYCTRYSDRPSAGPRSRKIKRKEKTADEKRPRTAFTTEQLRKLRDEFEANKYLTETRRQQLARELNLNESQIKIWFQNKRAKIKKGTGERNGLALELIAQGLYNHKTIPVKMET